MLPILAIRILHMFSTKLVSLSLGDVVGRKYAMVFKPQVCLSQPLSQPKEESWLRSKGTM